MPTSIHIPKPLLEAVDRRAQVLRISRNRLIVQALERELAEGETCSPGFFDRLSAVEAETAGAVDEMLAEVRARRRSHALARGAVLVTANLDDMVRVSAQS